MDARLSALGAAELRLLRLIALLGTEASVARLDTLMNRHALNTSATIERVESLGVVHLAASGKVALHECWQQAVDERLTGATRAALSLECARLLADRVSHSDSLDSAWRAAALFEAAGERQIALGLYSDAGKESLTKGLASQAAEAFAHALSVADSEAQRTSTLSQIADAAHRAGDFERVREVSTELIRTHNPQDEQSASAAAVALALLADSLWRLQCSHSEALTQLVAALANPLVNDTARQFACLFGIRLAFNDSASPLEARFLEASQLAASRIGPTVLGHLVSLIYCAERGTSKEVRNIDEAMDARHSSLGPSSHHVLELRVRSNALRWIGEGARSIALATEGYRYAISLGLADEAVGFAQQLVFQHLDECAIEEAEQWMRLLDGAGTPTTSPARARAYIHARARLHLQRGEFDRTLELYRPLFDELTNDHVVKRRVTDLSSLCLAAAECSDTALAERALERVSELLSVEPPTHQLDYPAETTVRALIALGRDDDAAAFGMDYFARRQKLLARPLPRYCSRLRELGVPRIS